MKQLESIYLGIRTTSVKRVAVVKFTVKIESGDGDGYSDIKVTTDLYSKVRECQNSGIIIRFVYVCLSFCLKVASFVGLLPVLAA